MTPPLEGIEMQPLEIQVVRLIGAVRTQTSAIADLKDECSQDFSEVKGEVKYMKRALWGMIFTVVGGMMLFLFTIAVGALGSSGSG